MSTSQNSSKALTPQEAKKLSIKDYLAYHGYTFEEHPGFYRCSSPFASDSTPSFTIYPTNYFVCYSTGLRGDIISLVREMFNLSFRPALTHLTNYKNKTDAPDYEYVPRSSEAKRTTKEFALTKYLTYDKDIQDIIKDYAESRKIYRGYEYATFPEIGEGYGEWVKVPAIGFVHRDENLKPTGIKFRRVTPSAEGIRFSARGQLNWYILTNLFVSYKQPTLFIMESETSANSLWEYCKQINKPAVILCFGGVSAIEPVVPPAYDSITDRRVIIDYDGDEEAFNFRMKRWESYGSPIKIRLDKGEDINSLFMEGRMDIIYELIR